MITVRTSTSVENVAIAQGQSSIGTSRETSSVDCASLRRTVELELMVISDIPNTSENVGQDTTLKGDLEWVAILAGSEDRALLRSLNLAISFTLTKSPRFQVPTKDFASRNFRGPGF